MNNDTKHFRDELVEEKINEKSKDDLRLQKIFKSAAKNKIRVGLKMYDEREASSFVIKKLDYSLDKSIGRYGRLSMETTMVGSMAIITSSKRDINKSGRRSCRSSSHRGSSTYNSINKYY